MVSLSILSVYEGDVKLTFDTANPVESIRARRIVKDMIRRGYALLIEVEGKFQRALDFDETKGEYIIADFNPNPEPGDEPLIRAKNFNLREGETDVSEEPSEKEEQSQTTKKRGRKRGIQLESTNAVAIARSAGG